MDLFAVMQVVICRMAQFPIWKLEELSCTCGCKWCY